jgi:hypothetical protein
MLKNFSNFRMAVHKDLPVRRDTAEDQAPPAAQEEATVPSVAKDPVTAHDQATAATEPQEQATAVSTATEDLDDEDSVPPFDINNLTCMICTYASAFESSTVTLYKHCRGSARICYLWASRIQIHKNFLGMRILNFFQNSTL